MAKLLGEEYLTKEPTAQSQAATQTSNATSTSSNTTASPTPEMGVQESNDLNGTSVLLGKESDPATPQETTAAPLGNFQTSSELLRRAGAILLR